MYFYCETDKLPLDYEKKEKAVFTITLRENGATVFPDAYIVYTTECDGERKIKKEKVSSLKPLVISEGCDVPGFVRITCELVNEDGTPVEGCSHFDGGAGFSVREIVSSVPFPSDMDDYREKIKKEASSVKPELYYMKELPSHNPDFRLFDVKIRCAGPMPVSGYLTTPKEKGKYISKVRYKGYGVTYPEPEYEENTNYLLINAHGFDNGREPEYYEKLANGSLKDYGMSKEENSKPETSYFYYMIVRALTAAEFMTTLDTFNGRDLILAGGSQGAMQAYNAASLCEKCTFLDISVPWICDTNALEANRIRYASPSYSPGLAYFDGTNVGKYIKCKTAVNAGLGDYVCQPSGVFAMYNNLKCEKSITFTQNMVHQTKEPDGISETFKN